MTTEEGNRLIAEFMEIPNRILSNVTIYEVKDMPFNGSFCLNTRISEVTADELPYHLSWDWLMPVVEKIGMLPEVGYFLISTNDVEIVSNNDEFRQIFEIIWDGEKSITKVRRAVIKFIEWYNQQ